MESVTLKELVRYFNDRLIQIDRKKIESNDAEPQHPMLVVYLGMHAMDAHPAVSAELYQMWPQYYNELTFLGVDLLNAELQFYKPGTASTEYKKIGFEEVQKSVNTLFGEETHFTDREKMFVYYVLDTKDCMSCDEFDTWVSSIEMIQQVLYMPSLTMLHVLMDESIQYKKNVNTIRRRMSEMADHMKDYHIDSMVLLSNCRADNVILENWDLCYKIIPKVMALSNHHDIAIARLMFRGGILAIGYAVEQKPVAKIGQVIICHLIDKLNECKNQARLHSDSQAKENLKSRLDMLQEGISQSIAQYVDRRMGSILPTNDQLELFPRKSWNEDQRIATLYANEFNDITMGAWNSYIKELAEREQDKLRKDVEFLTALDSLYRHMLMDHFTFSELIYLSENMQKLGQMFHSFEKPNEHQKIKDYAHQYLKYLLSCDDKIKEIFTDAISELGRNAKAIEQMWDVLYQSKNRMFMVKDENLEEYYLKKVRNFFDHNERDIYKKFMNVKSTSALLTFLHETIDRVIGSDPIFSASFEEELEYRLNKQGDARYVKDYVQSKLTAGNVHTYLQVNFALQSPIISSVLLNKKSALYHNLRNNLPVEIYYYNTGNSSVVEALDIYLITSDNLIN